MTQEKDLVTHGKRQFLFLSTLIGICYYLAPWQLTLPLIVLVLLFVRKPFLLAIFLGFSFFNIMGMPGIPFWGSLVTSFASLFIILARIGTFKRKVPLLLIIPLCLLGLIAIAFYTGTLGRYYILTGIKSSLQLAFLLITVITLTCIPERFKTDSALVFEKSFPLFLFVYLVLTIIFYDDRDRYGGATGAQCLALQLAVVMAYYCSTDPPRRLLQLFLLAIIFVTGSRTYLLIAALILIYDFLRKSSKRMQAIVLINIVVLVVLTLVVLPFTNSRLNYLSPDFWGTFKGRAMYYEEGWKLVKAHPVKGNGMGSMLQILENWVSQEGFAHYKKNGDTTIVHNEYLRVLIELGLVGLSIVLASIVILWRRHISPASRYILLILLIGSLMENTLTIYTTGTLTFCLVYTFANALHRKKASDAVKIEYAEV